MQAQYTLEVAGVTRQLPIIQISENLAIASFVILGDCEIVTKSAPLIEKQLPQVDYIITAEAKGIPPCARAVPPARPAVLHCGAQKREAVHEPPADGRGGLHHHAEGADAVPGR